MFSEIDNTEVEKPHLYYVALEIEAEKENKKKSEPRQNNKERSKDKKNTEKRSRKEEMISWADASQMNYTFDKTPKGYYNRPQHSEEQDQIRKKEYESMILDFVVSNKVKIEFPSDLNSYERRLVHDVAESHDLLHESRGEGKERHIVVSKRVKKDKSLDGTSGSKRSRSELISSDLDISKSASSTSSDEGTDSICDHLENLNPMKPSPPRDVSTVSDNMDECPICNNKIPKQNMQLHKIQCERKNANSRNKVNTFFNFLFLKKS